VGVTEQGDQSREDRSREFLRQVWLRNRATTMERLAVVDAALEALAEEVFQGDGGDAGELAVRLADYARSLPDG
jgi:hypothetical protein